MGDTPVVVLRASTKFLMSVIFAGEGASIILKRNSRNLGHALCGIFFESCFDRGIDRILLVSEYQNLQIDKRGNSVEKCFCRIVAYSECTDGGRALEELGAVTGLVEYEFSSVGVGDEKGRAEAGVDVFTDGGIAHFKYEFLEVG